MNHRISLTVGLAATVAVEILSKGPWSHAIWVPVLIMLITDLRKVFTGSSDDGPDDFHDAQKISKTRPGPTGPVGTASSIVLPSDGNTGPIGPKG
jgi:hypothetical protein